MMKINLKDGHYDALFAQAKIYAKNVIVAAVQINEADLLAGNYGSKGVRYEDSTGYVIDTYVAKLVKGVWTAELEDTRPIKPGEWIVTNPKAWEDECDNNYAMTDEKFQQRYEPTEEPGKYRAKGIARIIPNDTGGDVEIEAPWGGPQYGDKNCYFCAPYDKANPDDLSTNDRYILASEEFEKTYGLAEEVLGGEW